MMSVNGGEWEGVCVCSERGVGAASKRGVGSILEGRPGSSGAKRAVKVEGVIIRWAE